MRTRNVFVLAVIAMFGDSAARADVTLPHLIGDRMVLQRDQPIRIWGWADPGEEVTVTFNQQSRKTSASKDRRWEVVLPAMAAGGPFEMVVNGKNRLTIKDILIGEVWFCSGQSNMEMVVLKARDHDKEIAAADYPRIRTFTAPTKRSDQPLADIASEWKAVTPKSISYTSACAYFFAREIYKELNVPVGIMISAVGGTRIENWTPATGVKAVKELEGKDKIQDGDLYNGMVAPFTPLRIRGVIWYQGEGNVGDGMLYHHRMKALIRGWRENWGQGDFPFYYVQVAPLNWGGKPVDQVPELWEAQTATMSEPNTGMAVITDIVGNIGEAHPRNKQEVGRRLALRALARTYEKKDVFYSGPLYREMKVDGNRIVISFDYADGGLASRDGKPLSWFTIAGADGKFVSANAEIQGDKVVVSAKEIAAPVAVRFGWHQIAEPNLMNKHGLPASPFRTNRDSIVPKGQ